MNAVVLNIFLKTMHEEHVPHFLDIVTTEYAEALYHNKYKPTKDEAQAYAQEQITKFLSNGINSPGHILQDIILVDQRDNAETVIGHLWYEPHSSHVKENPAWLHYIYIQDDLRGKGYGRAALLELEKEVKKIGETRIGLTVFGSNPQACKLYLSLGYDTAEEKRDQDGVIMYYKMIKMIS